MNTTFYKRPKNCKFSEICAFATKELHDYFLSMYDSTKIDQIIISDNDKEEFFKTYKIKPVNCYSIITLKENKNETN